MIVVLTFEMVS